MLVITFLLNIFAFLRVLIYGHISLGKTSVVEKLIVVFSVLLLNLFKVKKSINTCKKRHQLLV